MSAKPIAAVLAVAGVVVAGAAAPLARAHGADAVVADLQAEGYIVHINWTNGFNTQQLSECSVVRVNNPDSSNAGPMPGATVDVDVTCRESLAVGLIATASAIPDAEGSRPALDRWLERITGRMEWSR